MVASIRGEPEGHADRPSDASQPVPDVVPLDVLVVDDDPHARIALCTAITRLGHHCREAGQRHRSARRARRAALRRHRERLDDAGGSTGWNSAGGHERPTPGTYTYLLFVSGHARKRDFVEAVRAGADDYLPKPIDLDDLEARLIGAARIVRAYRRLAQSNVVLHHDSEFFRAARVDPLTQVANRLQLEEDIEDLQSKLSRYGRPAAVAMCDLDGFKRYNDKYGHPAGDDALRRVAQAIRSTLRRADQVYRYGGEEFLTVLHEQSLLWRPRWRPWSACVRPSKV